MASSETSDFQVLYWIGTFLNTVFAVWFVNSMSVAHKYPKSQVIGIILSVGEPLMILVTCIFQL